MKQQGVIKGSLLTIALSAALMGVPNQSLGSSVYTVQPGDSLWKIAVKHSMSINDLKKANNLAGSEIIAGQQLIIPGQADQPGSGKTTYIVKPGDSLYFIARDFNITVNELKEANNLEGNEIWVGQELVIPGGSTAETEKNTSGMLYTVKPGDSLFFIARDFGTTVSELKSANQLTSDEIWVGQQLVIPTANASSNTQVKEYTVVPGDSLYLISKRFNTTVDKLLEINQLTSYEIYVGQVLKVPAQGKEATLEQEKTPETQPSKENLSWDIPSGAALHYVQPGDSLGIIAQKYGSSSEAVIKTNRLKGNLITPGMPLFVPVNSTEPIYGIEAPRGPKKEGYGELLDWEFANWHFNHHSTGVIKDLETGKTFKVYRIGGGNHADCEPLTAKDTEIFKSLFGGRWTWLTRPVILQFEGREIAASISGMPHAFDTIKDNNFDGMFDLHFLHSRTHKDNQESELHQQAVMKAAGY